MVGMKGGMEGKVGALTIKVLGAMTGALVMEGGTEGGIAIVGAVVGVVWGAGVTGALGVTEENVTFFTTSKLKSIK